MTSAPLRIYTDRSYLPDGVEHCTLLVPFWGNPCDHDGYDQFVREGRTFLRLTGPEDAEVAVLPFDGRYLLEPASRRQAEAMARSVEFVRHARAAGLRTIVIVNDDSTRPIPLPDTLVFRTSLNRRTRRPNEFALPAWHDDLVTNYLAGEILVRARPPVPSIGFCGLAATSGPPLRRRLEMYGRHLLRKAGLSIEHRDGIHLRRAAMEGLARSAAVRTEFIVRSQYFGGASTAAMSTRRPQVRREYVENLIANDYALTTRGYGNCSFRFFEAMSVGRIPLVIDTDCVFPYEFLHDYHTWCVIVPEERVADAARDVRQFHQRLSDVEYTDLQRTIRAAWVEWLSPHGFFRNLPLHWRSARATTGGLLSRWRTDV